MSINCEATALHDGKIALHLCVTDSGIGIAPDKQAKIFESFSQADESTTRRFGGTGLGLSISRDLTQLMGGQIWVESPGANGKGASFHISVPLPVIMAKEMPKWIDFGGHVRGKRCLLVDDSRTSRQAMEEILVGWGMRCDRADSGPKAVAILRQQAGKTPYDLMVLDLKKVKGLNLELAEAMQRRPELAPPPSILLSATGMRGDAARARQLGIAVYLVKPVRREVLFEAVGAALAAGTKDDGGRRPLVTKHTLRENHSLRSLNLLLAEDDPINQKVATMFLEKFGHKVTVAENGAQAVALVCEHAFDLVLMDVQMPEMDGCEASRRIRQLSIQHPMPPIIAMTAHALVEDRQRCLDAGMDDYITKPFEPRRLHSGPRQMGRPPPGAPRIPNATGPRALGR